MKLLVTSFIVCVTSTALAKMSPGEMLFTQGRPPNVAACISCHAKAQSDNAQSGFPTLTGLSAEYVISQLKNFADGHRQNPLMSAIAKSITEDERSQIGDYLSKLKFPDAANVRAAKVDQGIESIVDEGAWSRKIPACISCHGTELRGVGTSFPPLTGQNELYVKNQLMAWRTNRRKGDPLRLMETLSKRLTANEISRLAIYVSTSEQSESKK